MLTLLDILAIAAFTLGVVTSRGVVMKRWGFGSVPTGNFAAGDSMPANITANPAPDNYLTTDDPAYFPGSALLFGPGGFQEWIAHFPNWTATPPVPFDPSLADWTDAALFDTLPPLSFSRDSQEEREWTNFIILPPLAAQAEEPPQDHSIDYNSAAGQPEEPWTQFIIIPAFDPQQADWSDIFSPQKNTDFAFGADHPDTLQGTNFIILPPFGWWEPIPDFSGGAVGSLASLVPIDEFVNAPSGPVPGPAPLGRSARFNFGFPAFR